MNKSCSTCCYILSRKCNTCREYEYWASRVPITEFPYMLEQELRIVKMDTGFALEVWDLDRDEEWQWMYICKVQFCPKTGRPLQ